MKHSLRLSHQLFLVLATVSVVAIGGSAWLHARALEQGFVGYLNALESDRLDALSAAVARSIRSGGTEAAAKEWRRLLGQAARHTGRPGAAFEDWFGLGTDESVERTTRGKKSTTDALRFNPRASLIAVDGRVLAGPATSVSSGASVRDVTIDGRSVARIVLAPLDRATEDRDIAFIREQRVSIAWMAILAGIVSIALAAILAGWWSRRLNAVATSTARIAGGDLSARVTIGGHDEISTLALNVNAMAQSLAAMENSRRKWLADVAHELRTPLTTLRGEIEAMQDGVRKLDGAALASLHEDVSRLTRLTDDLHQLAIADLGALDVKRASNDLVELVERSAKRWRHQFEAAGIALSIDASGAHRIAVDADRIAQVLDNLLTNSLRYTDRPGRLDVSVRAIGRVHQIVFADSTPGLTDEELLCLFTPLYRTDASRHRSRGGSGLGLALSKAIIAAHGGSMQASASPLGGLRILIELPVP
ncbi:MAG: ATP-binding protein [Burkholderiales bacterium]